MTWEYALLELLADDAPEGFLFSFGTAAKMVWIGPHFVEQGQPATDPGFDIFAKTSLIGVQPQTPTRKKLYLFDSASHLLRYMRYKADDSGSQTDAEVSFSGWTNMGGQMVPSNITLSENGQAVFSVLISAATSSGQQQDSLFNAGN